MISLNGPCPCNSGKKYKRCCGIGENKKKKKSGNPANILKGYNTLDILQAVAAITLLPANHGKNIRLENIARQAIVFQNNSTKRVSAQQVEQYLRENYATDPQEDPPVNLFTEVIAFYGGDYLIFPGITESTAFILNNLLPAIFNWPYTSINSQFKNNCSHAVHLMLSISNHVAKKIGYNRYMEGKKEGQFIILPDAEIFEKLKEAVWISHEEMENLLSSHQISRQALTPFIADINDPAFKDPHIIESPLLKKPILATKEGYLVASPATISFALVEFIREHANIFACEDDLHKAYHDLIWNNTKMQLQNMGFKHVVIPGIEIPADENVKTQIARFDDDKIAIVQYIPLSQPGKVPSIKYLALQREELCLKIAEIPEYNSYEFLDISIPSLMGNNLMFAIMGNSKSQTLSISIYDFDIISNSKECKAIDLWKFALARERQLPRLAKMASLSFLDEYKIYKDHGDSFYLSDEGFDLSKWVYGHSQSLIQEVKMLNDEHSVSVKVEDRVAKTFVKRKDKYAPIYVSLMDIISNELQFEIEGFDTSVWVKPLMIEGASPSLRHIYWELTDTISYWLWQITEDIKQHLQAVNLPCILLTYELKEATRFENMDDRFIRDLQVYNKLTVSSTEEIIHMVIPDEIMAYFYGSDNEGDRIIVRQILFGINALLNQKGLPGISNEEIENIIDINAPLGNKKKFIILHTRSNLLLDNRNLKGFRYIQDYDTNVVADSIGPLLGTSLPPVGEITDPVQKKGLVKNIVLNALLPQLKKTISQYNNEELIKRLITLNEGLIRHREDLKIKTPTRIACFVSQEEHTEDLQEMLSDTNRTTIAVRCLLEHIAAEPSKGTKIVSKTGIDELIAIMDQIISWGSVGDQITFDLFDIKIGVLKTGRIGTQKTVAREIFDPYHSSKAKETVQDAINSFEQEFPKEQIEKEKNEIPPGLDKSFIEEFGISFSRICTFIDALAGIGFEQTNPFAVLDKKSLFTETNKVVDPFSKDEFGKALDFLALTNRGDVAKRPKGYDGFDISPWRFNRRLSLMRRPLIICETADSDNPLIYWGPRQVLTSRINLAEQCITDRLKVSNDSPVKKALSKLSQKRGVSLVKAVLENLQLKNIVLDSEVGIAPKGKLKNSTDIGDVDVLLIDIVNNIIYSLECKSFAPSRNIKEMIEECEKLLGSKSEKGLLEKHQVRHQWLIKNLTQVSAVYGIDVSTFTIKSAFITKEDMLFPYLKKIGVSLPFITLYDLEAYGFSALEKI